MKKNLNEVIEKQGEPSHPLVAVLQGLVAHVDDLLDALQNGVGLDDKLNLIRDKADFIQRLGEAGFFTSVILKVQAPLFTTDPEPKYLVYTEDRSLCQQIVMEDVALAGWFDGDPKMYVSARLWSNGTLQFVARVEEQPW